jgi:hypothetical protein
VGTFQSGIFAKHPVNSSTYTPLSVDDRSRLNAPGVSLAPTRWQAVPVKMKLRDHLEKDALESESYGCCSRITRMSDTAASLAT